MAIARSIKQRLPLLICVLGLGTASMAGAQPLTLETPGAVDPIGPYLEYQVETGVPLEVRSLPTGGWQLSPRQIFNLGLERRPIWLRLPVRNDTDATGRWVLALNRALLEELDIWLRTDGSYQHLVDLSEIPASALFDEFGTLATRFELPAQGQGTLYLRYRAPNASTLNLAVQSDARFSSQQNWRLTVFAASFTGVAVLVLYNLIMFFLTGLRPYSYYVLSQLVAFAYFSHLAGVTSVYLWPDAPESGRALAPLLSSGLSLLMCLFAREFLETGRTAPRTDRLLLGLTGLLALTTLIAGSCFLLGRDSPAWLSAVSALLTLVTWLTLPVLGIRFAATRAWRYVPVAVAWLLFAGVALYTTASLLALVPVVPDFLVGYSLFNLCEAMLLAISLALWVRDIRARALSAEQALSNELRAKLAASEQARLLAEERSLAIQELSEQGRLLQAAGHDSRQMLGAMRHYASGLSSDGTPEQRQAASQSILELTDHLDDVLSTTVGSYSGGGLSGDVRALEYVHTAELFEPLRMIHQRRAALTNTVLKFRGLGQSLVTDRALLLRILNNLLDNALKYAAGGKVLVAERRLHGRIRFEVWDNGPGLEGDLLASQLDADAPARRGSAEAGSGSGLRIAARLTRTLGGEIEGWSKPGKGSRFVVAFPTSTRSLAAVVAGDWRVAVVESDAAAGERLMSQLGELLPDAELNLLDPGSLESSSQRWDAVFVDYHLRDAAAQVACSHRILLAQDRSAQVRSEATGYSAYLLYKPVSVDVLAHLLPVLLASNDPDRAKPAPNGTAGRSQPGSD